MKKFLIILFIWVITDVCNAQNLRLIQDFDNIPLGSRQFELEGYMTNFNSYKEEKKVKYNVDDYDYREYYSSDKSSILLSFYKGILYLKRLELKYYVDQMQSAKYECENLKKYIISNNKIVEKSHAELTQGTYGTIGDAYWYYINSNPKIHKVKRVDYSGSLEVTGSKSPFTYTLVGYQIDYECIDLSKTELNATKGYSSVQN